MRRIILTAAVLGLVVGAARQVEADLVVAPNNFAATEADSFGDGGLQVASSHAVRYQQVFNGTEFVAGPQIITQIAFRPDAATGFAFSKTFSHIQVNFSTTPKAADGLSTTLADNVGADDTKVFDGSLTLSSAFTGPTGGPKDFDIIISFSTAFAYDRAKGNLLLDIRDYSGAGLISNFDATALSFDSVSHVRTAVVGEGDPFPLTGSAGTNGLVAQVNLQPAQTAVPEPSTLVGGVTLALLGLVAACRCGKRF